jgi:hypothetical protein
LSGLVEGFGAYWPFVVLLLVGFLPSEAWRLGAALLSRFVREESEVFVLCRLVASALVAAVVAKLLLEPPPALAAAPLWGRLGAVGLAVAIYYAAGRSMIRGIAAGLALIVTVAALNSGAPG